ncbi:hypothetical protein HYV85_02855 [Candidatus Woesearchaeota archaeon]|nr:hypothetical protein [Candidatus Woesearchaeota archaeon]
MPIHCKLKIVESDNSQPNVNVQKILAGVTHQDAQFIVNNNELILTATVPSTEEFTELKRRLSAKKNRPNTLLKIMEFREMANG